MIGACCRVRETRRADVVERLYEVARSRNTAAAIYEQEAIDERRAAKQVLIDDAMAQAKAREHLAQAQRAQANAERERALQRNALAAADAIDHSRTNVEIAPLLRAGTENVRKVLETSPELTEYLEPLLELPDAPTHEPVVAEKKTKVAVHW